jgi:hypothetical protein
MSSQPKPGRRHRENPDEMLHRLQKDTFEYFLHEANPGNGLVLDKTSDDSPASIAAVGFALTAYPIAVERGFCTRAQAVERTLNTLRFFANSRQSSESQATGYKGFYYHFLDLKTGLRAWDCELSTIDSALLLAGMLIAAVYFDKDNAEEREIRELADMLYQRADWEWARDEGASVSHGWKPESGFLKARWEGFSEALILYVLGLGSPTHPLPEESYAAWTEDFTWKKIYEYELLYAGPLFIHQFSHIWLDLRGLQDQFMRAQGIDYFENTRRATYVQQRYAIENPLGFEKYGEKCWGITASDGPGPKAEKIKGIEREFFGYRARGVPFGPDDGTLAPWTVVSSLPFAPEIVLPTIEYLNDLQLRVDNPYGFKATFNPTFPNQNIGADSWISKWHYGLNQGPIVMMIENYRSEMMRELMQRCECFANGLQKAGFSGGWLNHDREIHL